MNQFDGGGAPRVFAFGAGPNGFFGLQDMMNGIGLAGNPGDYVSFSSCFDNDFC